MNSALALAFVVALFYAATLNAAGIHSILELCSDLIFAGMGFAAGSRLHGRAPPPY